MKRKVKPDIVDFELNGTNEPFWYTEPLREKGSGKGERSIFETYVRSRALSGSREI